MFVEFNSGIFRKLVALVVVLSTPVFSASGQTDQIANPESSPQLNIMVTNARPYHYLDPDTDQVIGVDAQTTRDLFALAGLTPTFKLVSWSRAVLTVERRPNALIMPFSRTPERENQVIWIHPLRKTHYAIFGKSARNLPNLVSELKNSDEKVYCELAGIQCRLMIDAGIPAEKISPFPDATFERMVQLALRGRITYFIAEQERIETLMARDGISSQELPTVFILPNPVTDYLAINKDTDPEIVARLIEASAHLAEQSSTAPIP